MNESVNTQEKKGVGRSQKITKRESVLHLRVSIEEKNALEKLAYQQGISVSECHRNLLRNGVESAPVILPEHREDLRLIVREIRGIGINLNQITRSIHEGKVSINPVNQSMLEMLAKKYQHLTQSIVALLKGKNINV